MTIQTKLSNSTEIAQEPMVKRYLSQALVAIASLIIGLILGIFVTNLTTTATEVGMPPAAEPAAPTYSRGPTLAEYTAAIAENKASVQRAIEAETARYNGLVKFYGAKDEANSLAWPPRPTQFHIAENAVMPITENALAEYHQSEWGRTLSTVLPIAENGADADQDIGLMEFSTVVNESSPQRIIEADADQDIGLMEFLAVPNEISSQHPKAGTLLELHNK